VLVDEDFDRSKASVEIQRGDDGLDAVGQQRRLFPSPASFFSPPKPQEASEIDCSGHLRQVAPAHQAGPKTGPLPFVKIGKTTE
jgi:hypothetical protein